MRLLAAVRRLTGPWELAVARALLLWRTGLLTRRQRRGWARAQRRARARVQTTRQAYRFAEGTVALAEAALIPLSALRAGQVPSSWAMGGPDPWFDVKVFGAKGDGKADDTVAIQAAADAANAVGGGVVWLPPGTYLITSGLTFGSNVAVWGAGKYATVIRVGPSVNAAIDALTALAGSGQSFRDFTFDGNKANQTSGGNGIVATGSQVSCVGVRIINTYMRGVYLNASSDSLVQDCDFEDCGANLVSGGGTGASIFIYAGSNRSRILNNRIQDPNDAGIQFSGASAHTIIVGNLITITTSTFAFAIALGGLTGYALIEANRCFNSTLSTQNLIDLSAASDVVVSGNICEGGLTGIGNQGASLNPRQQIIANVIKNTRGSGIGLGSSSGGAQDSSIIGNTVVGAGTEGISVDSVVSMVIAGNVVKNSGLVGPNHGGIVVSGTNGAPDGVLIAGNRCYDDQGAQTQLYGINVVAATATNVMITGNDLRGNKTAAVNDGAAVPTSRFNNLGDVATNLLGSPLTLNDGQNGKLLAGGAVGDLYLDALAARFVRIGDASGGVIVGAANTLGFFGAAGTAKPAVSGAKGGNAALASLMTSLAGMGLVTDNTTA